MAKPRLDPGRSPGLDPGHTLCINRGKIGYGKAHIRNYSIFSGYSGAYSGCRKLYEWWWNQEYKTNHYLRNAWSNLLFCGN